MKKHGVAICWMLEFIACSEYFVGYDSTILQKSNNPYKCSKQVFVRMCNIRFIVNKNITSSAGQEAQCRHWQSKRWTKKTTKEWDEKKGNFVDSYVFLALSFELPTTTFVSVSNNWLQNILQISLSIAACISMKIHIANHSSTYVYVCITSITYLSS